MPGVVVWLRDGDRATWIGAVPPVRHWPAQPSEAQVGAMQAAGPAAAVTPSARAAAHWLRLCNPPQLLTLGGPGQPTPEPGRD
jgi:hypothetical protein